METTRITTPEAAIDALSRAAATAQQIFCIDEPPLPTLLFKMLWSAEEIALRAGLPEAVMDGFRRAVFNEHLTDVKSMTARELRETQAALLEYVRQELPDAPEELLEGITEWDDLLETADEQAA